MMRSPFATPVRPQEVVVINPLQDIEDIFSPLTTVTFGEDEYNSDGELFDSEIDDSP